MRSTSSEQNQDWIRMVGGRSPEGRQIISVTFARRFAVDHLNGRCEQLAEERALVKEPVYYQGINHPGKYRPSLLKRDIDLWAWRNFTDIVVQGAVRSDRPMASLPVALRCEGSGKAIEQSLIVTGDRHVERGPVGLRLSEPQRFTEMPVRYDKAYGGTDEAAEAKLGDPDELRFFEIQVPEQADLEMSVFSYPRNPAGKGYVVDADSVVGLAWPNIEFPEHKLALSDLVKPLDAWGGRPYPAGFDWFSHAWFPRIAFFGATMPTEGDKVPAVEVRMGILDADLPKIPLLLRPKHGFAQGAHPFLARRRLLGDETLRATSMSVDGRDFLVKLPGLRPSVKLSVADCHAQTLDASLDLVFLETELSRITLLWRSTWVTRLDRLPVNWEVGAEMAVRWR